MAGQSKISGAVATLRGAFWPAAAAFGAVATMAGEWANVVFGDGFLTPFIHQNLSRIGLTIFLISGVAFILKMEWRYRETDAYLGNEHKKALLLEGIPPIPGEYLRYVEKGNYKVVKRFWDAGVINVRDHYDRSDLHVACQGAHAAIADGILEAGADPKAYDGEGLTPLMRAAIGGNLLVVENLLRHNCAVNAKSLPHGTSALYIAAAYGQLEVIKLLLRHGAETDAVDHNNLSPLMAALAREHWDAAKLLIESGADVSRIDRYGATVMNYAEQHKAPDDLIAELVKRNAKPANRNLWQSGSGFAAVGFVHPTWSEKT
jgi:hypothetical protein